ncbi:MAG: hypothetical protein LBU88_03385 [Treponema sp.]|jgi:hypothetical protein|nr:hypothetical protein [Treponema sp.]
MHLPFEGYLKRKDAYEAADSGIVLWRKNFAYFIIFFAIPFWICAFAFRMLPGKMQYLSWVFMWYLKPFFDRLILHVISIRFFESKATLKRLFKGLGKTLKSGLAGDLLWRRFSPFRSSTMPLRVLEQSTKSINKYSQRKKLLDKGGLGYSFILTFWGLAMEIALLAGEFLFIIMMANTIGKKFDFFSTDFIINAEIYFFALWCFNYILVETIYVCMGFGVYINSRIEVEGWDIEIIFKGFAEKLKKKKILGILSIFCLLFIFVPSAVSAQDIPLEKLEKVLSSPDFGSEKDSWNIRLKNPPEEKENIVIINYNYNKFLNVLRLIFASGLRVFIILASIVLAVIIFFVARRYFKKKNTAIKIKPTLTIFSEIQQEDPQDILKKAVEFYKNSDSDKKYLRMAWGHCTAAAILMFQLYRGIVFPPNATENDCANIVNAKLEGSDEYKNFRSLIKTWVNFAYAGRIPPDGSFEEAIVFCESLFLAKEAENG